MKTELLHKYFRGEATEKEENRIVEWVESSAENKECFLKERMLFDVTLFSDDSNIQRKPEGHLYLYPLIALAAMLAIVFVMDLPHMHKPEQPLSQTVRIPAGQRAQTDLSAGSAITHCFDDVPLKVLLDKIALYYSYKITVKNPPILENRRYTGTFNDSDGIEHILKVIQKVHPFKYEMDNERHEITIE